VQILATRHAAAGAVHVQHHRGHAAVLGQRAHRLDQTAVVGDDAGDVHPRDMALTRQRTGPHASHDGADRADHGQHCQHPPKDKAALEAPPVQ
jgi:hypothetical protein